MATLTALVLVNQYSRKISLTDATLDTLKEKVRAEFKDVISTEDKLTFQMEDSDFGGRFVDYFEKDFPDKSVFKVVIEKPQVSIHLCLF